MNTAPDANKLVITEATEENVSPAINSELKMEEQYRRRNLTNDSVLKAPPTTSYNKYIEKPEETTKFVHGKPQQHRIQQKPYNRRALTKNASTYELETFERKILIIFNQDNVDGYISRHGTAEDVAALKRTFTNVGFDVIVYQDLTLKEILSNLRTFFAQDFTDIGCIGIAVLTHGSENGILRAKNCSYHETEITEYLDSTANPTMLTKPKFLILQACRGTKLNVGVTVRTTYKDSMECTETYTMPCEADQLILHSTYDGNISFRNTLQGSWLIQSLCNNIDALADTTDLESIIVQVKKEVAINRVYMNYKQIPVVTSTLIRKLYLKKFEETSTPYLSLKLPSFEDVQSSPDFDPRNMITSDMQSPGLYSPMTMSSSKQYLVYLINCLGFYLAENPEDKVAQSLLQESKTFGEDPKYDILREKMIDSICQYFDNNEDKMDCFKYMFITNNDFDDLDDIDDDCDE